MFCLIFWILATPLLQPLPFLGIFVVLFEAVSATPLWGEARGWTGPSGEAALAVAPAPSCAVAA